MKKLILCSSLLLAAAGMANAQSARQKSTAGKPALVRTGTAKKSIPAAQAAKGTATSLSVTTANEAKGNAAAPQRYQIADPTIRALNSRANGNPLPVGSSGIIGVPKRSYGFANGHIQLRSANANSIGTPMGSTGAVGTGTSPGSLGTHGAGIGVNGKSPYAGPAIWGTAVSGQGIRITDSASRRKD